MPLAHAFLLQVAYHVDIEWICGLDFIMKLHTGRLRFQKFGETLAKMETANFTHIPHSEVRIGGVCAKRLFFYSFPARLLY